MIVSWRNNHSIENVSPISAIDSYYDAETRSYILLMGDESGMVKIQDLTPIVRQYDLKPIDITANNTKRNPHRDMGIEKNTLDKNSGENDRDSDDENDKKESIKEEPECNLKGEDIKTINAFQAHKDTIKAIQYIHSTDVPLIFTAGLDRMAYIHNIDSIDKKPRGKFIQGYKTKP